MTFNYQTYVTDPTNAGGTANDAVLQADLNAALGVYSQYLTGSGTVTVQLVIATTTQGRETGGPSIAVKVGTSSATGLPIYEGAAEYELATGQHVSGSTSDITITIDPTYMKYLDMVSALSVSAAVPGTLYNPGQVFLHELMHGFGMVSYYSQTGTLSGSESTFDALLVKNADGTASFTGANVEAVYGGPVPITTSSPDGENYAHFGNTLSDIRATPATVADPLTLDVMNGIVFFFDYDYGVSALDLAMLKDLGYNVTGTLGAPVLAQATPMQYLNGGVSAQVLTLPSSTFSDPNAQQLTYKATQADGSALPSWIQFNAQTDSFTFTAPSTSSVGVEPLTVTATDRSGLSASETFNLIYGGYSATQAAAFPLGTSGIVVADTAANVAKNFDGLQKLASYGGVQSITLVDGGAPSLSITAAQFAADYATIKAISGVFTLSVAAPATSTTIAGLQGEAVAVAFSGPSSQFTVTSAGDGSSFTVSGNGVSDQISNVQALSFSDHTDFIASQTPERPGGISSSQVTDLYAAVFARTPDVAGLAYYETIAATNGSVTVQTFAQQFLSAPEYTANSAHNYAQTAAGDAQFITDTYNNLLHRAPETGAVAYYQGVINQFTAGLTPGTAGYTAAELSGHAQILVNFAASTEFLGDVQITAQHPADAQHFLYLI